MTVVTHNVITSGLLPKNMGWSSEGYRDITGVLSGFSANPYWFTSDWSRDQMYAVQNAQGTPSCRTTSTRCGPARR